MVDKITDSFTRSTPLCTHCKREFTADITPQPLPPHMLHADYHLSDVEIIQNGAILAEEKEVLRQYNEVLERLQTSVAPTPGQTLGRGSGRFLKMPDPSRPHQLEGSAPKVV
ncbi:hypothetical protein E1B28_000375 [Marasmius oreades]|uniref:Uncharacterized protein n=1 Tax=Marasmius oreades TaxID=181124 RepID=A0A9P7V159_9AGAR|nr:uncharacterized protein E1B28_000375 [Marasmius oreades]KAG7098423.1 hypothetical protein E1B28_000375 [Marasmius oreades]